MRRPFVAGNWKLNLGPAKAGALATELRASLGGLTDVEIGVFPTALSVAAVVEAAAGSEIGVGLQEIADVPEGAFTGANSAAMAREIGCRYALIGHSERRQLFGETDEGVRKKTAYCLVSGLLPVVCLGETLAEREANRTEEVVLGQLLGAVKGLHPDQVSSITLAYEPVWAIGTGLNATPDQVQAVHARIREWLRAALAPYVADSVRILYGGSVKADNAATLMACPDVDGFLVGGASLKADSFGAIAQAARSR